MDLLGRKNLSIGAIGLMGVILALFPVVKTVYPGILLLILSMKTFCLSFIMNSPFNSDYISKKSIGAAMAINSLFQIPGNLIN
jgi:hypothetical protein